MCSLKSVVHLTSVHSPFDIRIFDKECKTFVRKGYKVVLIAQHDKDEIVEGVQIRALSKPKNRFERMTKTLWQVYKTALKENSQIYHLHDPELIPVGIGLELKGKRVIYDVHEDYPSSLLYRDWIHPFFRSHIVKGVKFAERIGLRFFNGIVAATPHICSRFPSLKTVLVQNFPFFNELQEVPPIPYPQREKIVAYVGVISALRGAKEMIQAMSFLTGHPEAKLKIAGVFNPLNLEDEMKRLPGWDRVEFVGWKIHRDAMTVLWNARIGLILFHPAPNHTEAQPNKLFEYMSVGIPVVVSDFPLWRGIVEGVGCGFLVDPLNPKAVAEAIGWLLEHPEEAETMGKRGHQAVRNHYNWDREADKLVSFYQKITE